MKNPSEEITTAWLQEYKGYFTMNNIKVPKAKGGMGAEIDILGKNRNRNIKNIWVEVSVSTNPRCNYKKEIRFNKTLNNYRKDFVRKDKQGVVAKYFGKRYEKWLVYGKLPLAKEEIGKFPGEMEKRGIKVVYFGDILKDMSKLKYYRLDAARGYINLFETFR